MANIIKKPGWQLPEHAATPEQDFLNRRQLLTAMGFSAVGAAGLFPALAGAAPSTSFENTISGLNTLQVERNPDFKVNEPLTPLSISGRYNNFYEFSREKDDVWQLAEKFKTHPWSLEVTGLVDKPRTFDLDDLMRRMPIEERVYRFRCVEAWSMIVPWVGFPMSALLKAVGPTSKAKYVRMTTFLRPKEALRQGQKPWFGPGEPWPYTEGLTLAEAMHDLTLLSVGIYGRVLPKQHGAPIRLIAPWKYGFKNIKSIVRIELTANRPATFWNTLVPSEYGFESNVNPKVPHPRWSQAFERDIGTKRRKPTLSYNGYADQVAGLYRS